ncbi:EAL domain-containing protein [Aquincola sp. S2]|uniref:EAL domain-containing protein n=1 Tax=Pseudaquabacterium terrae TaxID=2732868 RepID=A0ABX2EEF6_9BURK|nr:EAL domain-containing protein [Aquabacterium terrae]NRF67004.1 EAL domain-containing protein [Aquabacterium terrae]
MSSERAVEHSDEFDPLAALRESEARFRSLTELSSDWYWEQGPDFRFSVRATGPSPHAALHPQSDLGKTRWELPTVGVSEAQWAEHRAMLQAYRPFRDFVYQRRDETGRLRWVSVSGHPVFDEHGAFRGYRGVGKDVTESKRGGLLLALEHAVARCLADADDAAAALRAVMQAVCEAENWEHGAYWRVDEAAGLMRMAGAWHQPNEQLARYTESSSHVVCAPGVGLVGIVWQSGDPLWVEDFGRDERVYQKSLARDITLRGMFVFPVKSDGRTLGAFAFFSREVREPDQRLLAAARVIGSQVGQFLHRKHREAALRDSEARFRGLCELSSDWYWEQDAELRFTLMSGGFLNKGNFRIDNALGKRRWELPIVPDDADWTAHRATLEARLPFTDFEYRVRTDDGSVRHYSARGEPLFDAQGVFTGYRGVANDISKRKQRDEELRRFRAALDTTADVILLVDPDAMRIVDVNSTACALLGYTRAELLTLGPHEVCTLTREELAAGYHALITGTNPFGQMRITLRCRDGSLLPVEASRRAIPSGDGWIIVGIVRDIRARLAAEATINRHAKQQSLIAAFGQKALANVELDELLVHAAEVAAQGLAEDFSLVLQLSSDGRSLLLRAGSGWLDGAEGRRIAGLDGAHEDSGVMALAAPRLVDDYAAAGAAIAPPLLAAKGIRSSVCVPIHGIGGPYGVLGACSPAPGRFAQESLHFLNSLANTLATAMDRKGAEQRLSYLAQFDTLTGLANRSLFLDRFAQTLKQAQRTGSSVGVLFIDLDRFKLVNDTLGHSSGDALLIQVAGRLQDCLRAEDAAGRLGGDEFAFVLPHLARPDDAALVAQKVVAALARPFRLEGQELYVTASLGIAVYPADGDDADTLLRNADTAMYRAKEGGRNTYQFYLPEMNALALQRLQLQMELRGALERREFLLHYQPKVDLASGRISGFEALLRWQHPVRGLVPPLQFISILEDTGLIIPVGEWVVRTVCEQLAHWQAVGITPRPVAINLSARQFQQCNLDTTIAAILDETGIDPGLLELELTESMLMSNPDDAARMLNTMRAHGVRLSVDDFGTGYSSLAYLKRFPLDALKIDRAFIRDVCTDADDATIALAIINLAHSLKLKVIAEGVESEDQLQFLRAQGCDEMQGYYFAKPLAIADCTRALVEDRRLPRSQPALHAAVG